MCGLAGYAGRGSRGRLERMAGALRRRGPDDDGFFEAPGVGFAFRRLAVIDVAGGHQPVANEDGTVQVMLNGEIYGFAALRSELEALGHRFVTRSDTEVVVHGYEAWGDDVFARLNGMFAIAVWDAPRRRLVLARDRMGKKPLYWGERGGTLWFASELKALLATEAFSRDLDLASVAAYFRSDAVPTPRSIFRGIQKMEPATAMAWEDGRLARTWSFWKPDVRPLVGGAAEVLAGLRERVDLAVRERLVSDVPLGLFLSGGIDSALVAESAARQARGPLDAFAIGFEDRSHDERPAARRVAEALGIRLHEEVLTPDAALTALDDAVETFDEPLADPAVLPQLRLAAFARRSVTVALTGDGGDEFLLGYPHVAAHRWTDRLRPAASVLRPFGRLLRVVPASSGYFSPGFKLQRLARGWMEPDRWARDLAWRGSWTRGALSSLLVPGIRATADVDGVDREMAGRAAELDGAGGPWAAWAWAYARTYLMDDVLVKVDRATMRHSLEARSPILDARVVAYLLSVPDQLKLGAWSGKRLFKELLRRRVPDEVLDRPKHGFAIPTAAWLRGPLAPMLGEAADPAFLRRQGLFDPEAVRRTVEEHAAGRVDRRKELWAYLMFQRWHRRWASSP